MKDTASTKESHASEAQRAARDRLQSLFSQPPVPPGDLMTNLGLYIRSSLLAKFLLVDDLYRRVLNVPGAIVEFGVWWGQNLVLFENLRAIHEPFNKTRKIVGFDTFSGYRGFSDKDRKGDVFREDSYAVTKDYARYLREILRVHEESNVLGHISAGHELVIGDIRATAPEYFSKNPGCTVALAYLDLGLYEPTKIALESIRPHLLPGSVILLDEFAWDEAPGEAQAFKDVFKSGYRIEKSSLTPMRAIVTIV